MSGAFVKEPDGDEVVDNQPELPLSPHPNYVTPAGHARLESRRADLTDKRRALIAADEGLAGKLPLAQIEREMRYLDARIERAIPIDPAKQPPGLVAFGALVGAEDHDGVRHDFAIVGEDEADAPAGKVSWLSPLARAVLGAEIGDLVTWIRPSGDLDLEILSIAYAIKGV